MPDCCFHAADRHSSDYKHSRTHCLPGAQPDSVNPEHYAVTRADGSRHLGPSLGYFRGEFLKVFPVFGLFVMLTAPLISCSPTRAQGTVKPNEIQEKPESWNVIIGAFFVAVRAHYVPEPEKNQNQIRAREQNQIRASEQNPHEENRDQSACC